MRHHISDDLLLSYEAGSLSEGWSLAVATHLALCPESRERARAAAAVGGALLEEIDAAPVDESSLDAVMDRIDASPVQADSQQGGLGGSGQRHSGREPILPEPLRSYVGGDVDTIRWRRLGTKAKHLPIKTGDRETSVRLLRIPGGEPVPHHGHRGTELTLVLSGTLVDGDEIFARGDIEQADESVEHQPSAGPGEDCICLAVTDAPLRFRGMMARLAQPFLRI
ncbi:ChrR family anti-sigma-E factor [Bauldia sp.]|uniref:ChrR family anti-sigma-E factor n=1 Tax=Bauldia sp. TaxID=2575872 RepID=UPI003BA966F1